MFSVVRARPGQAAMILDARVQAKDRVQENGASRHLSGDAADAGRGDKVVSVGFCTPLTARRRLKSAQPLAVDLRLRPGQAGNRQADWR